VNSNESKIVPFRREQQADSAQADSPFAPFFAEIRRIVREELQAVCKSDTVALLTPETLAQKLQVPVTWVYEQSRLGNIPTRRIGRYIRFDLTEVLESQKKKN
jgi:hypothetical protein